MFQSTLSYFEDYLHWAHQHEGLAAFFTSLSLIFVNTFCIPLAGVVMTTAGFLLKELKGFLVMYCAYNLSAWIGFAVGRFLLQDVVQRWSKNSVILSALSNAVQKRGWRLVFLLQLPPTGVPSPLLNYCIGSATRMPFLEYVRGTALGCPLHVFCYVYLGSLLSSVEDLIRGELGQHSSLYYISNLFGIVISVWVTIYAIQITRKEVEIIRKAQEKDEPLLERLDV